MINASAWPKKPVLFFGGLALASCSALLTWEAGNQLHGWEMGAAFVIFTIGACFVPNEAYQAFRARRYGAAIFASLITLMFIGGELVGELMVMTSARGRSDQGAAIQQSNWQAAQKNLQQLEKLTDELNAKNADQLKFGTPDSYDPLIHDKMKQAEYEGKKVRCGDNCMRLKGELAKLEADKAIAIDRVNNTAPALKKALEDLAVARAEAKATKAGYSNSKGQTDLLARIATWKLEPDGSSKQWTDIAIIGFMATLFTLGSAGMTFLAQQDWNEIPKQRPRKPSRILSLVSMFRGEKSDQINPAGSLHSMVKPAAPPKLVLMDPRSVCLERKRHRLCA